MLKVGDCSVEVPPLICCSAYEGTSCSILSWASFSFSNNLASLSSSSLLLNVSLDLRANIWTSKSSLGNLFCLNSLNMERLALPKIVRRSSGGLVTELSSSSLSTWTNHLRNGGRKERGATYLTAGSDILLHHQETTRL